MRPTGALARMRGFPAPLIAAVALILTLLGPCTAARAETGDGEPPAAFDVDRAVQAYLDRLSPEEKARSDAYFEGGYWIRLWDLVIGIAIAWLLLARGWSARLRTLAERLTGARPNLTSAAYAVFYSVATFLLALPWTVYTGFIREHQYGLATQRFGPWFGERLIGLAVSGVMLAVFLVVIYAIIRRMREAWHLWGAGASGALVAFALFVSPVFVEPLFNSYTPLADGPLKEDILSMARANGIPADQVYVVDASRQTTRISANVAGLFGTMRIALNDNLLKDGTPAEVRAVMGHEMGHYVLHHAWTFLIAFTILIALGFGFVRWGFARLHARYGTVWGVRDIADPAGFPLLAALIGVFFFVMTPVTNTLSRTAEAEADIFGLNAAHEPDGFAAIAMKLATYRKIAPGPIEEFIFYDHPSGRARVEMAMRWKAENRDLLVRLGKWTEGPAASAKEGAPERLRQEAADPPAGHGS